MRRAADRGRRGRSATPIFRAACDSRMPAARAMLGAGGMPMPEQRLTPQQREVLAVLEAEHRAFWFKDWDGYAAAHAHAPHVLRWAFTRHGGLTLRRGWSEIGPRARAEMAGLPRPLSEFVEDVAIDNLTIRVAGDMAWASFRRTYRLSPVFGASGPNGPIDELRILERSEGAWRIVVVALLDPGLGGEPIVQVSADGRIVWVSEDAQRLLTPGDAFVVRAGRLRCRDGRADIRLQAAIRRAHARDRGLMSIRTSVPIAYAAAEAMQLCWVTGESGMVAVTLQDRRPSALRIAAAVEVFAIVEGRSAMEFARERGMRPATARTHLRRIFAKVGVATQTGLVRVLVSIQPPG